MQQRQNQDFLCLKSLNQPFIMWKAAVLTFFRRKRRSHTIHLQTEHYSNKQNKTNIYNKYRLNYRFLNDFLPKEFD